MAWCLAEALWKNDRDFFTTGTLLSVGIARDESKNKLDMRFSATALVKGQILNKKGFLGRVAMNDGSAAVDIANATKKAFKTFSTPCCGTPAWAHDDEADPACNMDLLCNIQDREGQTKRIDAMS